MYFWVGSTGLGGVEWGMEMEGTGWSGSGGNGIRCEWSRVGVDGAEFKMGGAEFWS